MTLTRGFRRSFGAFIVAASAAASESDPQTRQILDRAVAYMGDAALKTPEKPVRINYRGITQRYALYQDLEPDGARRAHRFEVLLFDAAGNRSATRYEDANTDGTQAAWREVLSGDGGASLNLKSRMLWSRNADFAATRMAAQVWRIPHLLLRDLTRDPSGLSIGTPVTVGGKRYQVLIQTMNGVPVRILFDDATGAFMGQEFDARLIDGVHTVRVLFKDYRSNRDLGKFPSGFVRSIGDRVYQDMDVFDARLSEITEDWFEPPENVIIPRVSTTPPSREEIAPGVTLLRNVSGYNAAVADIGECLAVLDAPEQFPWDFTLPPASDPGGIGPKLIARVREVSTKPICYVVPTHHHADHFGGVRALLSEGASVVTTKGNVPLLRRVIADVLGDRANADDRIRIVEDEMVLGNGDRRVAIYEVTGDPHVAETLFFYFPANKNVFEADISDYTQSSKRFLQFIEERGIEVDKIYGVHNSRYATTAELESDEPSN